MVIVAQCTGLRVSEILALRWSRIDFESLTMVVKQAVVNGRVKGLKTDCSGRRTLCLATIQNAPGAVHAQEFSDIRICLVCGVEWPNARDFFVTG